MPIVDPTAPDVITPPVFPCDECGQERFRNQYNCAFCRDETLPTGITAETAARETATCVDGAPAIWSPPRTVLAQATSENVTDWCSPNTCNPNDLQQSGVDQHLLGTVAGDTDTDPAGRTSVSLEYENIRPWTQLLEITLLFAGFSVWMPAETTAARAIYQSNIDSEGWADIDGSGQARFSGDPGGPLWHPAAPAPLSWTFTQSLVPGETKTVQLRILFDVVRNPSGTGLFLDNEGRQRIVIAAHDQTTVPVGV